MVMNSSDRMAAYKQHIESYLKDWYKRFQNEPQKELYEAISYSLLAGGKRLRPILAFEFCRICGGDWRKASPFAAAIEMIHTYSLIHDDLPCMDDDDYRRGRLTNHKVFGEGMAVLAGDALLTDAFAAAAEADLSGKAMGNAIALLSSCAGSAGMVGGQVLDISSEERVLSEQEVLEIQSRKTGGLIKAACCCGAICGGANDDQVSAAAEFAANIGLAFQIRDDMLDVIGSADKLGKAVGVDAEKNTFVRLYGLEKCDELVKKYTITGISALKKFKNTEFLEELSVRLVSREM